MQDHDALLANEFCDEKKGLTRSPLSLRGLISRNEKCRGKRSRDQGAMNINRSRWPPRYARHHHPPHSGLLKRNTQPDSHIRAFIVIPPFEGDAPNIKGRVDPWRSPLRRLRPDGSR